MRIFAVCLFCAIVCRHECTAQQAASGIVRDEALGIAFASVGTVEKVDNATYRMTLQASGDQSASPVVAQLTATDRMFVDLPGSYGGRLYYDESPASRMMENRVLIDTVINGRQSFRREYWVVYAGMGMWDAVINCSTKNGGTYYVVSLIQEMKAGKPGEDAGGIQLTAETVRGKVLQSLRDTTNVQVSRFMTVMNSVQVIK